MREQKKKNSKRTQKEKPVQKKEEKPVKKKEEKPIQKKQKNLKKKKNVVIKQTKPKSIRPLRSLGSIKRQNFKQFCQKRNYPVEEHKITTKDNYKLQFYRIQRKNSNKIVNLDKVVYLQHGLTDSSDCWVRNQEQFATGFILANQGYDVWLGNIRGNIYSTPQISQSIHKDKYWDFTFDQMAKYDLPAAFNYIYERTKKKIHYIGHSQGTLIMFIALSEQIGEVSNRLASFCALGPVVFLQNVKSEVFNLKLLPLIGPKLITLTQSFLEDLDPPRPILMLQKSFNQLLDHFQITKSLLTPLINLSFNRGIEYLADQNHLNINNLNGAKAYSQQFPAGSSTKNIAQFMQYVTNGGIFRKYDYKHQNHKKYGQNSPPKYNLGNIRFPVHLFTGENDKLATVEDSKRIMRQLVNSPNSKMFTIPNCGHVSFLISKDGKYVKDIINIIETSL